MTRWKPVLFTVLIWVGFFGLLEGALWVAGVSPLIRQRDPFQGFSGLVTVFERDGARYRTRAAEGTYKVFNDQSFRAEKPAGGLRIFTLGGSSAYGYPWGAEASFSGVLGKALTAAHPDRSVESVNASAVSYGIHRLGFVAEEVLGYDPDVLIVYSGHNEFVEPAFFEALKQRSGEEQRLRWVLSHTRVYSGLRQLLRPGTEATEPRPVFERLVHRNETRLYRAGEKDEIVAAYAAGLVEIMEHARARGVKVVLATVPCNLREWPPEASVFDPGLDPARQAVGVAALAEGRRELAAGHGPEAVAALERAAQELPSHAEVRFLLGRARERVGDWVGAREAYRFAADLDASPVRRVSGINDAVRRIAREQGALLVDVEQRFEAQSEHGLIGFNWIDDYVHPTPRAHQEIAWQVWEAMAGAGWLGPGATARRDVLEQVVAASPDFDQSRTPAWYYNQAMVLRKQGDDARAVGKLNDALHLRPDFAQAHLALGVILDGNGRFSEALPHLQRAVDLDPRSAEAHNALGVALARTGKAESALALYRKAIALDAQHAPAHTNLGVSLFARGEVEAAIGHLRRALALAPENPEALNNLAWILATSTDPRWRNPGEAVRRAEQAVRITEGRDPAVLDTLTVSLAAAGRVPEAVETARLALARVGSGQEAVRRELAARLHQLETAAGAKP